MIRPLIPPVPSPPAADGRRTGRSRLVYDKAKRTIVTVASTPEDLTRRDSYARLVEDMQEARNAMQVENLQLTAEIKRLRGLLAEAHNAIPDWATGVNKNLRDRVWSAAYEGPTLPTDGIPDHLKAAVIVVSK